MAGRSARSPDATSASSASKAVGHAAERAIGNVLTLVLLVAVVVQLVRGEDASPYAQLLLVAGIAYAVTLVVARRRA